jgi:hypothetical protein
VHLQTGGETEARSSVTGVDNDLAHPELFARGHLGRVEKGCDRRPRNREPFQRLGARQSRAGRGDRGLTLVETIEAFEMAERAELVRQRESGAHRLPEVVLGDDCQRDPPAVGAREHAVTG